MSYWLRDFQSCHTVAEYLRPLRTDETSVKRFRKVEARLGEQNTGTFDFRLLQWQALCGFLPTECATYCKNVVIHHSQGRGRGLFAAQAMKAGELVMAEPAFFTPEKDLTTVVSVDRPATPRQMDILATRVIQELFLNPSLAPAVTTLYPNGHDNEELSKQRVDGQALINRWVRYSSVVTNS